MLDFTPQGLDRISTLSAYLGGTAIVALAILVAVGFGYFAAGKSGGTSRAQERGFRMVGLGVGGVMVLSSIGAAVSFGISQGDATLMPEGAQQQDVTVQREAPQTTCTEQAVRNFNEESDDTSEAERRELMSTVTNGGIQASSGAAGEPPLYIQDDADTDASTYNNGTLDEVTALKWYPEGTGGDCSAENESSTPDTQVDIELVISGDDVAIEYQTEE